MKVPLSWLADYVDLDIPVDELAHRLTMAGIKVEGIERIGADWDDVITGHVIAIEPHPSSRKPLHVATVDVGGKTITVVTGAQNVGLGDKAPVVLVGGSVPHGPEGGPMLIEPRPMAGIVSEGMLASARELGISDEHSGIYILPPDTAVGVPLRTVLGDDVLDIETQPNRPDTLSIIGIAREVAAITEQQLTLPDLDAVTGDITFVEEPGVGVEVTAPDLAPRYTAQRIDGVSVRPSPFWLVRRLQEAGVRPINLLVDLTNYVMLEFGQPLHAFDSRDIEGGTIIVRRAAEDEYIRTLDGVDRTLTPETLVIADLRRAIGLAGVMGGENSEIRDDTTSLVLESATFDAIAVRKTAKALGLRSEASSRFEKGLSPETALLGSMRFLQLLAQVSDRHLTVHPRVDVCAGIPEARVVALPLSEINRLLGIEVSSDRAAETLSLQGFDVTLTDGTLAATVPYWRRADIAIAEDLVEEVARFVGYETIPSRLPAKTLEPPAPSAELVREDTVRRRMLSMGVSEVETGTLTSEESMRRLFGPEGTDQRPVWEQIVPNPAGVYAREALTEPVTLLNPPTRERDVLRMTLLPSILGVAARNLKHTDERVAFFEMARTFFARPEDLPYERRTLAIVLTGNRRPPSWQQPAPGSYTFYDLEGMVEAILDALHVRGARVEAMRHPALHPGRAAVLRLAGRDIANMGELHPLVAERFDIDGWPVQVAEIDLDGLAVDAEPIVFQPLHRYPAARRDIAVIVAQEVAAADVLRAVREEGGEMLEDVRVIDVYSGPPLPENAKNLAVAMVLRAPGATLTQEEIALVVERIVARLEREFAAQLRA